MDENKKDELEYREEIFSRAVRAGKRTYFFDVKATRRNEYYLTITESKKRMEGEGRFRFEKHKLFLYKEDFDKFADGLQDVVDFIRNEQPLEYFEQQENIQDESPDVQRFSNVEFEDF